MPPSVPEALRGRKELLDPEALKRIIAQCGRKNVSTQIGNAFRDSKITYLGMLLILPEKVLLKHVTNFGKTSLAGLSAALEKNGYTIGQAQDLFLDFESFLKSQGFYPLRNLYSASKTSKSFIAFSAALKRKLAELYEIELPENPPPEIPPPATPHLPPEIAPQSAIVTHIAGGPDRPEDVRIFYLDAFENAVRYFFDPDPLLPPPAGLNNNPSPDNECIPFRTFINLRDSWTKALTPSFIQKVRETLSKSAFLRWYIVQELYQDSQESHPEGNLKPAEIYLEMSLPKAIVRRISKDPDTSRDLNRFCQDAFENAVRYFFDPDPLLPPPAGLKKNPSPDNKCRPLRIPITLSHAWTGALNPSFLQNLATQLSSSAALRHQIMEEFGPATPK